MLLIIIDMPECIPKIVKPLINILKDKKKYYYIEQYISFIKLDLTNQFVIANDLYYLIYKHLILNNDSLYIKNINNAINFFKNSNNLQSYYSLKNTFTNIINNAEIKNINIINRWTIESFGINNWDKIIKINNIILVNDNLYITLPDDSKLRDVFYISHKYYNKYPELNIKYIKKKYNLKKINLYLLGYVHMNEDYPQLKEYYNTICNNYYIISRCINKNNLIEDLEEKVKQINHKRNLFKVLENNNNNWIKILKEKNRKKNEIKESNYLINISVPILAFITFITIYNFKKK